MYTLTGAPFYDAYQHLRQPGEPYLDYRNRLRRPGLDDFMDAYRTIRRPGESFRDTKNLLVSDGGAFYDGRQNLILSYNR